MIQRLRVWIGLWLMSASAFFGYTLFLFPAIPLSILSLDLYYRYVDMSLSTWLRGTIFVLEDVWNIKFHFYCALPVNDDVDSSKHYDKLQLVISNHATNFDWMYMWVWLAQIGKLGHVRNILKSELKNVPGFGWAMQCAAFVFLERNWLLDKPSLRNMLRLFRKINSDSVLVLFPEGTSLSERSLSKSNKYAKEHNLREYRYCLHPRTTGFNAILEELNKEHDPKTIYDATIAFKKPYPVEPADLIFRGILPPEVHILYRVHHVAGKLNDAAAREHWLRSIWEKKEDTLERFYQYGHFDGDVCPLPSRRWYRRAKLLGFLLWLFTSHLSIILLYRSYLFRIYIGFAVICTMLIRGLFSGITEMVATLHAKMRGT